MVTPRAWQTSARVVWSNESENVVMLLIPGLDRMAALKTASAYAVSAGNLPMMGRSVAFAFGMYGMPSDAFRNHSPYKNFRVQSSVC
jgi:hypothetical protein